MGIDIELNENHLISKKEQKEIEKKRKIEQKEMEKKAKKEQREKEKKEKKEQKEKEKKQKEIDHVKLLEQRKNNFFGKSNGNTPRKNIKRKKKKKIQKTYIDKNGMFVTEDVLVT